MKLGECQWKITNGFRITPAPPGYPAAKFCTVARDGVHYTVGFSQLLKAYQVITEFNTKRPDREHAECFWCNSELELAAFLQDKEPL